MYFANRETPVPVSTEAKITAEESHKLTVTPFMWKRRMKLPIQFCREQLLPTEKSKLDRKLTKTICVFI